VRVPPPTTAWRQYPMISCTLSRPARCTSERRPEERASFYDIRHNRPSSA
jgi:hypothetical protein